MSARPLLGLLVEPFDVRLELLLVDAPHAAAPDLDGRQGPRANQRVGLRDADVQEGGYVVERQEARLDDDPLRWGVPSGDLGFSHHALKRSNPFGQSVDLPLFASC